MTGSKRPIISIMADFGSGPYAWIRSSEESAIGPNIADVTWGLQKEYGVSKELDEQFAEWVTLFERNYDKNSFDWAVWEERGINLASKLKKELGDSYSVEYHYPCEDPTISHPPPIIIID